MKSIVEFHKDELLGHYLSSVLVINDLMFAAVMIAPPY